MMYSIVQDAVTVKRADVIIDDKVNKIFRPLVFTEKELMKMRAELCNEILTVHW